MANQGFLDNCLTQLKKLHKLKSEHIVYVILLWILLLIFVDVKTTFRVLDAKTKKPIEGAVALAEWYGIRGLPGLTNTKTTKIVEAISDKRGNFTIWFVWGFKALNPPHLKVYKPGYVGWDSRSIYLGCYEHDRKIAREVDRKGFSLKNQDIFLEPWKDEYSFVSHWSFIGTTADFGDVGMKSQDSKYRKAIRYEVPFRRKEKAILRKKRK